jgi:hypothetical protein
MQRSSTGSRRLSLIALATVLVLSALLPSAASASFHEMKVREVFPGAGTSGYVELQMYAAGQNLVTGHDITTYNAAGAQIDDFEFPGIVSNGQSQRTILVGGSAIPGATADFVDGDIATALSTTSGGGAVCFDAIPVDCVAWGAFAGFSGPPPGVVGTPAPAIPADTALVRSIALGCATLLEADDDTDVSNADFSLEPPNPRPNTLTPTETPCNGGGGGGGAPQTEIDKTPKKKIKGKKAKFTFSSPDAGATFECALDKKPFKACESPFKVKVKPGKHTFSVRAVLNGTPDNSPATFKFKRVKKK